MKRTVPLLITAIAGFVLIVAFFIPSWQGAGESAAVWFDILASIAFVLGGGNLLKLQLRRISDREPGWGYAAVTLASFVIVLVTGLLKWGSPPEAGVERFGQSAAFLPLTSMPEFRVTGVLPARDDDVPAPDSVRRQFSAANGELIFRGWMSDDQHHDLLEFFDTLEWRVAIDDLHALAQPAAQVRSRLAYDGDHEMLLWTGDLSAGHEELLVRTFTSQPGGQAAVDQLIRQARRETSLTVGDAPPGFRIPETQLETVRYRDGVLSIIGPMTVGLRNQIARDWTGDIRGIPFSAAEQASILAALRERGPDLNAAQAEAFDKFMESQWQSEPVVQTLNSAGSPPGRKKTNRELLEEVRQGAERPELIHPAPEPMALNAAQERILQDIETSPPESAAALVAALRAAGPLSGPQESTLLSYFSRQPTRADQLHKLWSRLIEFGALAAAQREFLVEGKRRQFAWEQQVGVLFLTAHHVKFPWSGDYTAPDSPFWWCYEYILQPLLTTTFALLGFYVASAAFRAFRAKNVEASLLLGTAFLILLGATRLGELQNQLVPDSLAGLRVENLSVLIMSVFNTAGNRAIMIGIALGTASTSLRVLLGIDRSYLGSGDD